MNIIFLVGRVLFGGYFLWSAYSHFAHSGAMAGYAASKGVPSPRLAILGSGLLLLIGGASILFGFRPALLAWALVLFLIPVTFTMHAFWKDAPEARQMNQIQFGKNMALLGAVLMLIVLYR